MDIKNIKVGTRVTNNCNIGDYESGISIAKGSTGTVTGVHMLQCPVVIVDFDSGPQCHTRACLLDPADTPFPPHKSYEEAAWRQGFLAAKLGSKLSDNPYK